MRKLVLIAAAAAFLQGCSTPTIPTSEAKHVERGALLSGYSSEGDATVTVKRNRSLAGMLCADRIFANGKPVADLGIGQRVDFKLPAGRHVLGAEKQGICPSQIKELTVELKTGERRAFLVDVGYSGENIFQETATH